MREDWVEVELEKLVDFALGGDWGKAPEFENDDYEEAFCIRGAEFKNWKTEKGKTAALRKIKKASLIKRELKIDDILVEISGGGPEQPVGRTEVIDRNVTHNLNSRKIVCTNFLRLIRLNNYTLSEYTNLFLKYLYSSGKIIAYQAGSNNLRNLKFKDFLTIKIPLTSLPEQKAIVKKIEKLFTSLDKGIEDLQKAQQQLKIYRQAVLKKAFEESPTTIRKSILDIVVKVQIGPFGSQLHKEDYIVNGIPLINPMHIQGGKIKPNVNYTISKSKRDSLPNYILELDDVIMGRRGEMGRCALVSNAQVGWFCGTGSLYLRPRKEIIYSRFLYYYMRSAIVKEFLTGSSTGTTMMNLNKKIVNNIPIYLPKAIAQQHQIVKEIETRFSVCDQLEEDIKSSLEKSEALRQSILKKAFEGKLLSQQELDECKQATDYEPAEVLLRRIEQSRNEKVKQGRNTSKKK